MNWSNPILASLWQLWTGAISFDPDAYLAAVYSPSGRSAAFAILLLAGLSLTLGQSAVLFANRIPPRRLLHSLGLGALLFGVITLVWTVTIWIILSLAMPQTPTRVFALVGVSFAPMVFGFLILLPYLGNLLFYLLYIWVLVDLLFGLRVIFGLSPLEGLLAAGPGWLFVVFLAHTHLMDWLLNWTWRISGGPTMTTDIHSLAEQYAREIGSPD